MIQPKKICKMIFNNQGKLSYAFVILIPPFIVLTIPVAFFYPISDPDIDEFYITNVLPELEIVTPETLDDAFTDP